MKVLLHGDCLDKLKELEDNSVDSIVTDPPYGLSFMNKKWDYDVPSTEIWTECLRVLKPGGHLLSFGGSRTYHRMAVRIEDAGFEIRDQIMWIYGSGFPKSHNIGKAVDKLQGIKIETGDKFNVVGGTTASNGGSKFRSDHPDYVKYQAQNEWEGWGTALKPAHEPIVVARKPLSEKSVAENVLKWGTGGMNIDVSRIEYKNDKPIGRDCLRDNTTMTGWASGGLGDRTEDWEPNNTGRWPANIILDEEAGQVLDQQSGVSGTGKKKVGHRDGFLNSNHTFELHNDGTSKRIEDYGDKGGASRFFYCPKTSKKDRDEDWEPNNTGRWPANIILDEEAGKVLDEQSGIKDGSGVPKHIKKTKIAGSDFGLKDGRKTPPTPNEIDAVVYNDKGGASRFFYCPKTSKKDRDEGLKSYIELFTSTIKIIYYTKDNLWETEDQKTKLVDMDTSLQKVIEEYGVLLKNDLKWNTGSYGNYIMDQLKKDLIFTTEMETNSIMILETLNLLIEKNTRIYIQELLGEMVKDIKFVKDVEQKNTILNITIQNKNGYWQNVNLVELNEVWNINTVQGKSSHPTVKPTSLMEYLIKLVTPVGGTVLDPFMGSGSTGKAAVRNGFDFIGIEREEEYIKIAQARIEN